MSLSVATRVLSLSHRVRSIRFSQFNRRLLALLLIVGLWSPTFTLASIARDSRTTAPLQRNKRSAASDIAETKKSAPPTNALFTEQTAQQLPQGDSRGTDFWLIAPARSGAQTQSLLITSAEATTGNIVVPATGFTTSFSTNGAAVTSNAASASVEIPVAALNRADVNSKADVDSGAAIHVTSQQPVSAYVLQPSATDGHTFATFLALPTNALGTHYRALSYQQKDSPTDTFFTVLATAENTTVTITPSASTATHPAGTPFTLTLNQGQSYHLHSDETGTNSLAARAADLSGSLINSDKAVAVFSGYSRYDQHSAESLPAYAMQQLPAVESWGRRFALWPLATRTAGDTYRLLAAEDETHVSLNGSPLATLAGGQFLEQFISAPAQVTADKPLLVARYSTNDAKTTADTAGMVAGADTAIADAIASADTSNAAKNTDIARSADAAPLMLLVTPTEQFLSSYIVSTPAEGLASHYLNVLAEDSALDSIMLDGIPVSATRFNVLAGSGLSGAQLEVSSGTHQLSSKQPFGVTVYGFNAGQKAPSASAYGFNAGMALGTLIVRQDSSAQGQTPEAAAAQSASSAQTDCQLYPIALSATTLNGVAPNTVLTDIFEGTQSGNFGWLSWAGSPGVPTLVTSLTPPGDSNTYINPDNSTDHEVSVGDWVTGKPGVSNSSKVRSALDELETIDITVPVWNATRAQGSNAAYRVSAFARMRLISYRLPSQNRITARFLGYTQCPITTNQPPEVDAGPGQTITLSSTASLQGTATDDGLPTGSTLTTTWSKTSGPGTVTFGNVNAKVTTASFSQAGTYVLRLTASDSQLTAYDEVTIVVNPANQPPVVNAGPNQTVTLPSGVNLAGSASDDDLPVGSTLVTTWSKVSGPGTVTFGNVNATVTTASFSQPGVYVLRLTASDSQLTATSDVTITVKPANQAPQANAGADQTITLSAGASLNGTVADDGLPEGSQLTSLWSVVSGPGTVVFDNPNVTVTTAHFSQAGTYVLRLTASDSVLTNSDEMQVTVNAPLNRPPVITSQPVTTLALEQTTGDGQAVNPTAWSPFQYEFNDQPDAQWEIDAANNIVTQVINADASMFLSDFNLANDRINGSWRVNTNQDDDFVGFVFGYTDAQHYYLFDWKKADQTDALGFAERGMSIKVVNADTPVTGGDLWPTAGNNTRVRTLFHNKISWQESTDYQFTLEFHPGMFTITVKQGETVLDSVTLADNTYRTGRFGFYNYSQEQVRYTGFHRATLVQGNYVYPVVATDPDNDPITYSLLTAPAGMTIDAATGQINWAATAQDFGPHDVTVRAQDPAGLFDTQSFVLNVTAQNHAPVVEAGTNQTITLPTPTSGGQPTDAPVPSQSGESATNAAEIHGTVSDDGLPADGQLTANWTMLSGPGTVTFADASQPTTRANFSAAGQYVLRLTASDGQLEASDDVTITVIQPVYALTASPSSVTVGNPISVTWEAPAGRPANDWIGLYRVGDPNTSYQSYQYTQGAQSGTFTFTAPSTPGQYVFRYLLENGYQSTAVSNVVVVNAAPPVNQAPVVDAGPDQSVSLPAPSTTPTSQPFALRALSTGFNAPIGIDYHEPTNKVVLSVNYPSGQPSNFELVAADGTRTPFSEIRGLTDELKLATARGDAGNGMSIGGFRAGELFAGTGTPGVIARISPDGSSVQNPWVTLPNEPGLLRGSLYVDRTGVFGGDLIAVTTMGGVWRINSAGQPTRLMRFSTHLEGLSTIPNDAAKYGPWAGKILVGAEEQGRLYTVDTLGNIEFYELGIAPEDIDLIPANENFFGVDYAGQTLWGAAASSFTSMVGDVLIAQESPGLLYRVRWNGHGFDKTQLAQVPQWEHVTFAPAGIAEIPSVGVTVQLHGTVTDDNAPGYPLAVSWTKTSGPGTVAFSNPNQATTNATFTVAGTYVLRLSANDTQFTATDEVTVVVNPNNAAPTVNAGADQAVTLPCAASLHGIATDDGKPSGSSVSTSWSMVSGPGTVTFADEHAATTTATFSAAGQYVLRLTASDSEQTSSDDVSITVNALETGASQYFDPRPYLSFHDSTLGGRSYSYFHLEDFEDHQLNTPGVHANVGTPTTVLFGYGLTDSVDGDDGLIDGNSLSGESYFDGNGATGITFTFDQSVLGSLPTHVGVVWTDGAGQVYFEAFDSHGVSMGRRGPYDFPDAVYNGTTAEDRFLSVYNTEGISAIKISNTSGGIEVDHLQYGHVNPNHAPTVNAGADQSVNLPAQNVALNAAATDDGLPACTSLSLSWSMVSGPGTVAFADEHAASTTANFSALGAYVLRLTATDAQFSASDDVVITVLTESGNQAPIVDAGPDRTVALSVAAVLQGTATDDGKPLGSTLSVNWTKVSGTGNVTFANAQSAATTATFSASGTYVLALTASDSELSATDSMTVTVAEGGAPPTADFSVPGSGGPVQFNVNSFSSFYDDGYGSYHPRLLLDNSAFTYWYTAFGQVTNQYVKFATADGQPALIDRVRLQHWYGGASDTNLKDFEIQVSNATANDADFTTVLTGTMQQSGSNVQEFVFQGGAVAARFVKLVAKNNYGSNSYLVLGTFQAVSLGGAEGILSLPGSGNAVHDQSPALIANGGSIYRFSYGGGADSPNDMLDYRYGGWGTVGVNNQFAIIQLAGGRVYTLDGVKLATWYDYGYGFSTGVKNFEVWVSSTTADDAAFTKVLTASTLFNGEVQSFQFPGGPVQARYVKYVPLTNHGGNQSSISTESFDVIARGTSRVVGFSSQLGTQSVVEAAFDGDNNTIWYGGNNLLTDQWMKVALTDEVVHKIYGVRIRSANSLYYGSNSPKDFEIRVSTTTTDDSAFQTVYTGTLSPTSLGLQEFLFNNFIEAKYVEFYWKNTYSPNYMGVIDLEVLSAPERGSVIVGYSSSDAADYQGPGNALDIDPTNYPWITAAGQPTDQWLKLLLPKADLWTIDHVALQPGILYGWGAGMSPKDFEIQVSTTDSNDASFHTIFSGTLVANSDLQHFRFAPAEARYVKLLLKNNYGSDRMGLHTFFVYTPGQGSTNARFIDRSTDSDGHVVAWSWNFGDGGTSTEQHPTHQYNAAGSYNVSLTVTDNTGLTGSHQLLYHAAQPVLADFAVSPVFPHEGGEYMRITDTTELLQQSNSRRIWDFGDGVYGPYNSYSGFTYYTYPDSGTYTVKMKIGDDSGLNYTVSKQIQVLNMPPTVSLQPGKVVVWGEQWTNAPNIWDPSSHDRQSLTGMWNYGDGQSTQCQNCTNANATATHAYALPGTYTAALTISDKDGGQGTASAVYTVNKRPTSLTFTTAQSEGGGQSYLLRAQLLDTYANQGMSGKLVVFSLNGATISATTGADGVASASLAFAPGAQVGLATVTFVEDDMYLGCGGAFTPPPSPDFHPVDTRSSRGTDFWLMFPHNYFDGYGLYDISMNITSDVDTTGTVTSPRGVVPFTVQAHGTAKVSFSVADTVYESDIVQNKGIHITSQQPVAVYGLNYRSFTADAYLGLPTNALGTDHIIVGYANGNNLQGTEFGVVAAFNATTVTITPSVTTGTRTKGVPYQITLNQGQTYMLRNDVPGKANDITGTIVTSNKPLAVFGGHLAASIPDGALWADHLVEQLPSTDTWGKHFVTMPLATRQNGDTFRFLAARDNTHIYVNGSRVVTLNRGQFFETIIKVPSYIIADQPILVAQYPNGASYDSALADPSMMLIPPYEQFLEHYTVINPDLWGFTTHHINVVAPTTAVGQIMLDGALIPSASFVAIGSSGFSGAQVAVGIGSHNLSGPQPFGAHMYGFGQDVSYAYPGGMNLLSIINSISVALAPKTGTPQVGTPDCATVTVKDQDNLPVGNQSVSFTVSGANNQAATSAVTNAAGQAQFCYTGTHAGDDVILASLGTVSDTAARTWQASGSTNQPPVVNAGADQTITLPATASLNATVTDDGLPAGSTLSLNWSKVSGGGTATFTQPNAATTGVSFSTAGTYVLRLTASDSQLSASDDVTITVNQSLSNQPPVANAGPDQSVNLSGNLLTNAGNEAPISNGQIQGWTQVNSNTWTQAPAGTNGFPPSLQGATYFYAGDVATAELRQDVDLSAFAPGINNGTQEFAFAASMRSGNEAVPDICRVVIEYRDATNSILIAALDSGPITSTTAWHLTEDARPAPQGTRWMRIRLIATRQSGTGNDCYFDALSLRATNAAAVKLDGTATDDGLPVGGTLSAAWTKVSGPGAVSFGNSATAATTASFTTAGTYVLRLTTSDSQLSGTDEVTITVLPVNQAPVVNAGAAQTITLPASATLAGVVTDDGSPVGSSVSSNWMKVSGPGTVSFGDEHAASTSATFTQAGTYVLRLTASDTELTTSADVTITVQPPAVNQAPQVSAGADQSITLPIDTVSLSGTATDDGLPVGSSLSYAWTKVGGAGTVTFGSANQSSTTAQFSAAGTYVLRLTVSDSLLTASDDVVVVVHADNAANLAPTVNAGADQTILVTDSAQLNGTVADDGLPEGSNVTSVWTKQSGPGTVMFGNANVTVTSATFSEAGTYVLLLTASDTALTASDEVVIQVNEAQPRPTVSITAPVDGAEVTSPTDVTGSVSHGTWKLEYSLNTEDGAATQAWQTIATGTGAVNNGRLGTLDPTMMLNGIYNLRLSAVDVYGQTAAISTSVVVTNNLKLGNFTITFSDLSVPVAGLPIEITRTYDSRDKRQGDFGIGWTLGIKSVRLEKSGVLGTSWYETRSNTFLPNYCIEETKPHVITITFPEGKTYKFKAVPAQQCQRAAPIFSTSLVFTPMNGTHGSLVADGATETLVAGAVPGPVDLISFSDPDIYNSTLFHFTTEDGTEYLIDQKAGVKKVTDTNGNYLTIDANGITHSSGKSVTFTRDTSGRITHITDPAGNVMDYTYDAAGDLTSFKDRENNTSTYGYNNTHYLLSINDPRGIQPVRNEYDDNGRLISHTDAFGKVVVYDHDLVNRVETLTDRTGHPTRYEYDLHGNVLRSVDAKGGVKTYTYDGNDNMLTVTSALGKTTTYTYDTLDHPTSVTDPAGNVTRYTYNDHGQVLTMTDPLGRVKSSTFDPAGNVTLMKDALGHETRFAYSVFDGELKSTTDAQGNVTSYDNVGSYVTKVTDPLGNSISYTYDSNGNRLTQTLKRTLPDTTLESLVTTYEYDRSNRLKKTTHPDGTTEQVEYNQAGQQSADIDRLGRRTEYTYDDMGRLIKTTFPDNTREELTYDAEGRKLTSKDRGGRVTSFTYDELGRLSKTTYPDGAFITATYDAIGRVIATTDERGNVTHFEYDPNCNCSGRRTKITDAQGHSTTFTYDGNGNQLTMTDARGNTITYEYDVLNRRTKIIYADSTTETTVLDEAGRALSKTDQAGKTTQFAYDKLGRLTKVTDALSQVTQYAYDEMGHLISQTDANNHTTRFEYDRMGRRSKRVLPSGISETFTYNTAGNLASRTDFNGKTTTYTYDLVNRLTQKTPDATLGQPAVTFAYTTTGHRSQMVDAHGTTTYTYDSRDRMKTKQTPEGTLAYNYDAGGNLLSTQSSNANGMNVNYGYDDLSRLTTITDNRLASSANTTTYAYDTVGNLGGATLPNNVTTSYAYNNLNRLTNVNINSTSATLATFAYTLGAAGNRLSVTENNGRTVNYTYDALYRLTNETITSDPVASLNGAVDYAYDTVGNRLTRTSTLAGLPDQTFSYDANDRLTADTYDHNGNTITANGNTYNFDFENHLTEANSGAVRYLYDGDGHRVAKMVGAVTTKYLIDTNNETGYSQVADELTGGQVTRTYTYGHSLISQTQLLAGQWETSFYGTDGHGSVRLLTDTTGAITDTYTYDAFGNLIASTGSTPNERLYAAEQYDPNLGFYYLRARYMNPSSGRFVSMDLVPGSPNDPQTLHKYLYAMNNPVNRVDPSGLFSIMNVAIGFAVMSILASMAVMGYLAYRTLHNLPKDPWSKPVMAGVVGYQVGFSPSKAILKVSKSPLAFALAAGFALTTAIGGVDFVVPFANPRLWVYGYLGSSFGVDTAEMEDFDLLNVSLYGGLLWNIHTPEDYEGPFYCTSLTTSSLSVTRFGFPVSASTQICSSRKDDGVTPGPYGFTMNILGKATAKLSSSYTKYFRYTEITGADLSGIGPSFDGIRNMGYRLLNGY